MKQTRTAAERRLTGRRVFLRRPHPADRAEFVALNRASIQWHRRKISAPTDARKFIDYLKRSRGLDSKFFLVCRRGDGVIMGAMNVSQIFRRNFQSAYLGYYIGAVFAGQGYMTEAMRLLLRHVFGHLKLHRLEANIQPGNTSSLALIRRAGFVREGFSRRFLKVGGRWRDHERWALLAEDWLKRRS